MTSDAGNGHAPASAMASSWVSSASSLSTDLLIISIVRTRRVQTLQFAALSLARDPRFHEPTNGSAGSRSPPGDSRLSLSARYLASALSGSSRRCIARIRSHVASCTSLESCLGLDAGRRDIRSLAHRPMPNDNTALRRLSFSCWIQFSRGLALSRLDSSSSLVSSSSAPKSRRSALTTS